MRELDALSVPTEPAEAPAIKPVRASDRGLVCTAQPRPENGPPVESVWDAIDREAGTLAIHEPLLESRLRRCVLEWRTPAERIAATLASRLGADDLPESSLRSFFVKLLCDAPQLLAMAERDIVAVLDRDPSTPLALYVLLNQKGFHALQTHRLCHALWQAGRQGMALTLASAASQRFGVDIHPAARIGSNVMLDHGTGIVIGETAVIDDAVSILQGVTLGGTGKECGDRHPKIGAGVLIGAGATVLGNIRIGAQSKVAAGSVVLDAVPPRCTVAGVPARIVRRHETQSAPALDMDQAI